MVLRISSPFGNGQKVGCEMERRVGDHDMKVQFKDFIFDPTTCELWQAGASIPLQPQPGKVLALLISRAGEVVTRLEIQSHVWGADTHVDYEQGLNWCVRRIREVLGDSTTDSQYIQTVPRVGYRFLAEVRENLPVIPGSKTVQRAGWRRSLVASVLVVAGVCGGIMSGHSRPHTVTVLILPFENVSFSQTAPQFGDIASNQLNAELARINPQKLNVIDPLTAKKFKDTKECIIKIGNQLGADYVLLGDVEPSASEVKVDAQLFRVSTNRQVWAAQRLIPRDGTFSPIWREMSGEIGAQLQQNDHAKN